ncbi:Uncharacterised protein [Enterobacter ludwigii]|nr:hypothetical protein [Enterobacter ludwigii]CZU85317.1 Uncharacterised protein [Enterobacter ludwigii]
MQTLHNNAIDITLNSLNIINLQQIRILSS